MFTLGNVLATDEARTGGVCGIDVGWRKPGIEGMRVAVGVDDNDKEYPCYLPTALLQTFEHAQQLQADADTAKNEKRYDGINGEKCLRQRAVGTRARAVRWRNNIYRKYAANLATINLLVNMEKLSSAKMGEQPDYSSTKKDFGNVFRYNKAVAAVSTLHHFLSERCGARKVLAVNTSKTCHECGEKTSIKDELIYTCEHCGTEWNRDVNAAKNIRDSRKFVVDAPKGVSKRRQLFKLGKDRKRKEALATVAASG